MIDRSPAPAPALGALLSRVPPQNLEAERAVLCSVFLDVEGEIVGTLVPVLEPQDFYRTQNRLVYEAMLALYGRGEPVVPIAVLEHLKSNGILEQAGGLEYLTGLVSAVESPAHAEYYAKIVREKSLARSLIATTSELQQLAYEETAVGSELLEQAEAKVYELGKRRGIQELQGVSTLLNETFAELEGGGGQGGLRSGFTHFDELTGGLKGGELIVVAGRPSMGKSTLALNVARHAATREQKVVAIFSLEMTARNIVRNILCAEARVDAHKMRPGQVPRGDDMRRLQEAAALLFDSRLFVDDTPALTPTLLRAKARRLSHKHGLDLLVIDYLQLMSGDIGVRRDENRQQEISTISRSLKHLARELDVPVIALSQLNRAAEQREGNRPRLSDLRESGAIEQDADVICMLYRPEYYLGQSARADEARRAEVEGKAEVIIGKQRNGPTGTVHLHFFKDWMRFDNPAPQTIP